MNKGQTAHLQQIMLDKSRRAKVLAVTSGKGGVGKTNIAANLAICLAAANKRIVLMDADMGLGNLDIIMNINSRYNIGHVISGEKGLDEIIHIGPGDVEVICSGSGIEALANLTLFERQRLIDELDTLQDNSDVIIIDTGAGINASAVGFCQAADHVLVITTPEPTAMTDAYAMIKVLSNRDYAGRISLVVNMADSTAEGRKIYRQIANIANRFLGRCVYEAGVLCRDDKLVAAVRMREPVVIAYPKSKITSSLAAMAARLSKGTVISGDNEGFFRRVVNWFF